MGRFCSRARLGLDGSMGSSRANLVPERAVARAKRLFTTQSSFGVVFALVELLID